MLIRKNIRMSEGTATWFEKKAKEMGVSQSSLMAIALSDYIKMDNVYSTMPMISPMIEQLNRMKEITEKR